MWWGAAANPTGDGYWLVANDGGVFAFGGAQYQGSLPGDQVHVSNVVAMVSAPDGGYWITSSDGGVFAFGAPYLGSLPGLEVGRPRLCGRRKRPRRMVRGIGCCSVPMVECLHSERRHSRVPADHHTPKPGRPEAS